MARTAKPKRVKGPDGSFVVRGKAANGEGSLYQEADGVWRATYWVPGETRPRRVRGRTREEAFRRRLEAVERAVTSTSQSPAHAALNKKSTVSDMALWWLETVARHRVRPSSFGKYEDRVARIIPTLGDVPVGELRPEQVARWQSGLLSSLSPKTVADTRATLRSIMEEARNLGVVASNVVDRTWPTWPDTSATPTRLRRRPTFDTSVGVPRRQPRRRGASSIRLSLAQQAQCQSS